MRFAAIGLDHRHIYHMVGGLLEAGAICAGYLPADLATRACSRASASAFPTSPTADDAQALLDDPSIDVLVAAPRCRATARGARRRGDARAART